MLLACIASLFFTGVMLLAYLFGRESERQDQKTREEWDDLMRSGLPPNIRSRK